MEEGFAKVICKDTVLDIGCGIRPREEINAGIYICCEPYSEYVKELKSQFLCLVLNKNVKFNGFHFCCMDCYDYFKKTLCEGVIVNR